MRFRLTNKHLFSGSLFLTVADYEGLESVIALSPGPGQVMTFSTKSQNDQDVKVWRQISPQSRF
jgi:hypothetical protein